MQLADDIVEHLQQANQFTFKRVLAGVGVEALQVHGADARAVGAMDGFGILAMASIGPILSVMGTGLWIDWKIRRKHAASDREMLSSDQVAEPGMAQ